MSMFQDFIIKEVEDRLSLSLRDYQRDAILTLMDNRDLVVSAPTGAGKSAIYQGAALAFRDEGCTVVISPLVALLRDQAHRAHELDLDYAVVYGEKKGTRRQDELAKIAGGADLVLATPESLQQSKALKKALGVRGVALIVIDEAHAFEDWALSFRSVYRRLGSIARTIGARRWLLCSATITAETAIRAIEMTKRQHWSALSLPATRPNLSYRKITIGDTADALGKAFLGEHDSLTPPGIVFAATVRSVQSAVRKIAEAIGCPSDDVKLLRYHGKGMTKAQQRRNQKDWMDGCAWIVATNAFGMGIDKANVRNVVHLQLPASLTAYAQEAGRAGRDGEAADCWLNTNDDGHSSEWLTMRNYPSYEVVESVWRYYRDQSLDWQESQPKAASQALKITVEEYRAAIGWLQGKKQMIMRPRSKDYRIQFAPGASGRCRTLRNGDRKKAMIDEIEKCGRFIADEGCFVANREDLDERLSPIYKSWRPQLDTLRDAGVIAAFQAPSKGGWLKCAFEDFQFDPRELEWARTRAKHRIDEMRSFAKLPEDRRSEAIACSVSLEIEDLNEKLYDLFGEHAQVTHVPVTRAVDLGELDEHGGVEL